MKKVLTGTYPFNSALKQFNLSSVPDFDFRRVLLIHNLTLRKDLYCIGDAVVTATEAAGIVTFSVSNAGMADGDSIAIFYDEPGATEATLDAVRTELVTLNTAMAARSDIAATLYTDTSGAFYLRRDVIDSSGSITVSFTDSAGGAAIPGAGLRPLSGTNKVATTVNYDAIAGGTGYSAGDVLSRVLITDISVIPPTAAAVWQNMTAGVTLAAPPTIGTYVAVAKDIAVTSSVLPDGAATDANISAISGSSVTGSVMPAGGAGLFGWLSGIFNAISGILNIRALSRVTDGVTVSGSSDPGALPVPTRIVGNPVGDYAGVDLLEMILDPANGLPIPVQIIGAKVDSTGGQIASDAPAAIPLRGLIGSVFIIDTQGYQSFSITPDATFAGTITGSNDRITWSANLIGSVITTGLSASTIVAATPSSWPTPLRYLKITLTAAGGATAYLRSQPFIFMGPLAGVQGTSISQILGVAAVTGGLAGTLGVGGAAAAGAAPTTNPINISGVDSGGLQRRVLMDTAGRMFVQATVVDTQGVQRQLPVNAPILNPLNSPSLSVIDISQAEGSTPVELLMQMLTELRIMNFYLSELPRNLSAGLSMSDEPALLRNDPTLLN